MRTGGEIAGLAVVREGERIGRVQDVLFEPNGGKITGFLVSGGGLFSRPQFLPRLMVRSLGADAVVVEPSATLEDVTKEPIVEDSVHGRSVDDRPVIDESGKLLGKVADVAVDPERLTVAALVVGTGFVDNLLRGKPHLPMDLVKHFGGDSIVASSAYDPHASASHASAAR